MDEIELREMCCTNPSDREVAVWYDNEDVAKKVNEVVRWINKHEQAGGGARPRAEIQIYKKGQTQYR